MAGFLWLRCRDYGADRAFDGLMDTLPRYAMAMDAIQTCY